MVPRKLSDSEKRQITSIYCQPGETTSTLAQKFGISSSTVSRVLKQILPEEDYTKLMNWKRSGERGSFPLGSNGVAYQLDAEIRTADTKRCFTVRRTPRTGRGFIEPLLDVGDAIPLHLVRIPGGTFTMGSPDNEPERTEAEGPQHEVTVPMCFMGRYPITQAQYEQVMETNPATKYEADRLVAPNKPVVGVSWDDATTFCQRLSERTGRTYRLPSEAEWEYACRAGTTTPFFFGHTLTTEVANYDGNNTYADGPEGEYRQEPTPVDHFKLANAFGLCDMHGNVHEWCADHWHENYEGAPTDGSVWIEGGDSSRRVIRGGSWDNFPRDCRSAYRDRYSPVNADDDLGFRVVCSPPRPLL